MGKNVVAVVIPATSEERSTWQGPRVGRSRGCFMRAGNRRLAKKVQKDTDERNQAQRAVRGFVLCVAVLKEESQEKK